MDIRKKILVIPLVIFLSGNFVFAQTKDSGAGTMSFFDLQQMIVQKNPLVLSAKQEYESKKSLEGSWGRSFLPDVQAEYGQERFKLGNSSEKNQNNWNVEAKVNLFRGGSDLKEEKIREISTQSSKVDSENAVYEALQSAYDSYWDIAYKTALKKIQQEHLKLTEQNLQEAQRRIQAGISSQTDRLEFQMKLTMLKQELTTLDREIKLESQKLALALGLDNTESIKPELAHIHEWEASLGDGLKVESLALRKAKVQKQLVEASRSKSTSEMLPEIDFYAGVASPNDRMERDVLDSEREERYMGLRASWSLGKTVDAAVQKRSLRAQLKAQELVTNYQVQLSEVMNSSKLEELKTLHSFVHDSEENIKIARGYFNQTLKEYGRGVKNSLDVLAATEKYIATQVKLSEITRDFNSLYARQLALKQSLSL